MPETVAVTCTVPVPAGLVAVQLVVKAQETPAAAVAPKWMVVAPGVVSKPVPVMVTVVPPTAKPLVGAIAVTVGGVTKVKPPASVPLCVSVLVTTTSTAPAACAAVVAWIVVALVTLTPVAARPPMVTVAPARKPVPVMVTAVPPAVDPADGATALTVGAA